MPLIKQIIGPKKTDLGGEYWKAFFDKFSKQYNVPYRNIVVEDVLIGVEVEVENVPARGMQELLVWQQHADGSLRNNGIEFVSWPMKGQNINIALNCLAENLPKTHQFSQRTSIHIHMDVQELEVAELMKFFALYLAFEPLLYEWVGKDRKDNIFCVPWYKTWNVNKICDSLQNFVVVWKGQGGIQGNSKRYSGLNFEALNKFGTLEFRHMGGTKDIDKIVTWINILLTLRKAAIKTPINVLTERICSLNTSSDYIAFTNEYLEQYAYQLLNGPYAQLLELGCRTVKYSTVSNEFAKELAFDATSPLMRTLTKMGKQPTGPVFIDEEIVRVDPRQIRIPIARRPRPDVNAGLAPPPPAMPGGFEEAVREQERRFVQQNVVGNWIAR